MRQLILLFFLFSACETQRKESTLDGNISIESFENFFTKFKADSSFQVSRVKFPLTISTWGEDDNEVTYDIQVDNWRHIKLEYDSQIRTRKIDAYIQEVKLYSDSAKVELRGVDNGISVDYVFRKVDGRWMLISERDYSD